MSEDAPKPKPGKKKHGLPRRMFRWFRIACLLVVLALVAMLIWLNQVGLPGFIKDPLLAELRARGVELQFDRLRFRWYRGIVAERVTIGRAAREHAPQLTADEVTLRVNADALRKFHFEPEGLILRDAKLTVPLLASNAPPRLLVVDKIQSELLLLPGDLWELADLQGEALGAKFTAAGTLTNASLLPALTRRLSPPRDPSAPPKPPRTHETLRRVIGEIEAMQFSKPPELALQVRADAADTNDFLVHFTLAADQAQTRWGRVRDLRLHLPVTPAAGPGLAQTRATLQFTRLDSPQLTAGPTKLDVHAIQSVTNPLPERVELTLVSRDMKSAHAGAAELRLKAQSTPLSNRWQTALQLDLQQLQTKPVELAAVALNGNVRHTLTNFSLLDVAQLDLKTSGVKTKWAEAKEASLVSERVGFTNRFLPATADRLVLSLDAPQTKWGSAGQARVAGDFSWNRQIALPSEATALAGWTNAWPFTALATLQLTNVVTPQVQLAAATLGLQWSAPKLQLTRFQGRLYDGSLDLDAALDALTREVSLNGNADFDVQKIAHLFKPQTQKWLGQHEFAKPPDLTFDARATLPAWTNRAPDWRAEVLPTTLVRGAVKAGEGKFRTVPYVSAQSSLRLENTTFEMPDLTVQRPEGTGRAHYRSDIFSRDYYWKLDTTVDPKAVLPLLGQGEAKVINEFEFTTPPGIRAEIWGRWYAKELTGVRGEVALTNFVYRGGQFTRVAAAAEYTNLVVRATNAVVENGDQRVTVEGVTADIGAQRLFYTNVFSTFDPYAFTRMIGPQTAKAIEPYKFATPPTVRLNGSMHFNDEKQVDLRFDISGGPFRYWKLNFDHVEGQVHWVTNTLVITNLNGRGYDGDVRWSGFFDFAPPGRTDFRFHTDFTDLDVRRLLVDLHPRTNSAEGRLNGTLTITDARSNDTNSWQGFGHVHLREGHLWDIPLVGMLSGPLNAIIPGLGKSKVKEGEADFILMNSVVHTSNLELKAPTMRLQYKGSVDLAGRVDAEVEAELLRDAWIVGRIFSLAMAPITKAFVFKVTGTLNEPKSEPLYIPKFLLLPLKPFKVLRDIFTDDEKKQPRREPDNGAPPGTGP